MTAAEFSRQFDVRFNNIDSNLAHSVTEYEKSLYLTQAQLEIVKNYFNPKGNKYQEGFDGSPKREIDFSNIIIVHKIGTGTSATPTVAVSQLAFGTTSLLLQIPANVLAILNERFQYNGGSNSSYTADTTVVPIEYNQYQTVLGKAYKDPPLRQTWRLVRGGAYAGFSTDGYVNVELIPKSSFAVGQNYCYTVRFIKYPKPIITFASDAATSIQGLYAVTECELSPEIHEEILARAVELCKADYLGDLNNQVKLNERVE
jgi:hypothetical protein